MQCKTLVPGALLWSLSLGRCSQTTMLSQACEMKQADFTNCSQASFQFLCYSALTGVRPCTDKPPVQLWVPEPATCAHHSSKCGFPSQPKLKPAVFQSNLCSFPFCRELPLLFLKQNAIVPYFVIFHSSKKLSFCQAAAAGGV